MKNKFLLLGIFSLFLSLEVKAEKIWINCHKESKTPMHWILDVTLKKEDKGTYTVSNRMNRIDWNQDETETISELECRTVQNMGTILAIHCTNPEGQAFNLALKTENKIHFDSFDPKKSEYKITQNYDMAFMFHNRSWAESGPDSGKWSTFSLESDFCRVQGIFDN